MRVSDFDGAEKNKGTPFEMAEAKFYFIKQMLFYAA